MIVREWLALLIRLAVLGIALSALRGAGQAGAGQSAIPSPSPAETRAAYHKYFFFPIAIATNTPAFDQYAFGLMLKEAEHVRLVWKLKRVPPLTTSNVTFDAVAKPFGVSGEIGTMDHLFRWDFEYNALRAFVDARSTPQSFSSRSVGGALAKQIPLGKKKSILTAKQAEELARWYLHALGLTEKQLRLSEPPRVRQYLYFDEGIEHPLPLFEVAWILSGASEIGPGVTFDISGVTGEVAAILQHCNPARDRSSHQLHGHVGNIATNEHAPKGRAWPLAA